VIISYSNNFVVIRPPKTGSTSLLFYFLASGLVDAEKDIYVIDKDVLDNVADKYRKNGKYENIHRTFDDARANGAIPAKMPCVSTIRNPLERLSSLFNFLRTASLKFYGNIPKEYANPNIHWDWGKQNSSNGAVL
jgi:hypothetical protein